MSSYPTLVKATCLLAVLAVVASCLPEDSELSGAEQNPFETIRELSSDIKTITPVSSARERCLSKQRARLAGCGRQQGQERAICEAVAQELLHVCEQMNPDSPAHLANALFCKGTCAIRRCPPPGCPVPGGMAGNCRGNICAAEKAVCDPGILFDCECITNIIGPLADSFFCACACV